MNHCQWEKYVLETIFKLIFINHKCNTWTSIKSPWLFFKIILTMKHPSLWQGKLYAIISCEFEHRSLRGELDTTISDKLCQWLATGRWFSPGTPVSSTNKTDRHDITEILLKVALNTINQPNQTIVKL